MREGCAYLKVKIKSLVEETKIIRKAQAQTRKKEKDLAKRQYLCSQLAKHRQEFNKGEMRSTLLAYGFLRGRPYARLEPFCSDGPNWDRVRALVKKYGPLYYSWTYQGNWDAYKAWCTERDAYVADTLADFEAWYDAAIQHISDTWGNLGLSKKEAEERQRQAKETEKLPAP